MQITYRDLIEQTFDWPSLDFEVDENHNLNFNGISLMKVAKEFGTPLKLTYLPKIGERINDARAYFRQAIEKLNYQGTYTYCYCTKSSHFSFILNEVLKHNAHLETSSAYDMDIISYLAQQNKVSKDTYVICNGFKRSVYVDKIASLINEGFENVIPVLDNMEELDEYEQRIDNPFPIGLRIATEEEPKFEFYTSRLGIRYDDILRFYQNRISDNPQVKLKMLHFFVNTGIGDNAYYWNELSKAVNLYCDLKAYCPELNTLDIGGGFPVPKSLNFDYDYQYMVEQILGNIQEICFQKGVKPPHIFTEFGSYTVAESGANLYSIIGEKKQNDSELWYMIDNSFITSLPDAWGIGDRFILLAANCWDYPYQRANLGGLTCDSMDYYNSEIHVRQVFLPQFSKSNPLVIGFFNTGAYQEALAGYGGIKHCLIPGLQHVLVDRDDEGNFDYRLFKPEQSSEPMMRVLGYLSE